MLESFAGRFGGGCVAEYRSSILLLETQRCAHDLCWRMRFDRQAESHFDDVVHVLGISVGGLDSSS